MFDSSSALPPTTSSPWIHLKDPKSFSRLLYTNPVCFLTTTTTTSPSTTSTETNANDNDNENHQQKILYPHKNVMVVSWLSPTNNNGRFMMSINKRRHTSTVLLDSYTAAKANNDYNSTAKFVLSVPVAGMEELVLNVGKVSGRWGKSKFPKDHDMTKKVNEDLKERKEGSSTNMSQKVSSSSSSLLSSSTTRSANEENPKRKKKFQRFSHGIEGLHAIQVGSSDEYDHLLSSSSSSVFAIQGTVAHMVCQIYNIPSLNHNNNDDSSTIIDEDHDLILCEIIDAYVNCDYWDETKKQFIPQNDSDDDAIPIPPPYLTFLGSQRFGYISSSFSHSTIDE